MIPLCVHCRSWQQNYSLSSRSILYWQVKKVRTWVNICSCWASASPDSQAATMRSSQCGHNSESMGGEINCTNLLLDNTMRGWWRRMKKRRWWEEGEEEKLEKDRSRHLGRQGLDGIRCSLVVTTGVHEINVLQMIDNWESHHLILMENCQLSFT